MPPKRLLEPPASPEVKSASPKRRRRGAARGGARRGTPKRNARGLFEVGLAIEDMVRDVEAAKEASPVPRSDFGQKVIFWAFYCRSSNFAALARPLRARASAPDRPGHTLE